MITHIVDDDSDGQLVFANALVVFTQNALQESGLSRAEEARQNGDFHFDRRHGHGQKGMWIGYGIRSMALEINKKG